MDGDTQIIVAVASILSQIGMGAAAWRLANRVARRQEATDERVDGHDVRIGVLEKRPA